MLKVPVYMFDDETSKGLENVPLKGIVFIKAPKMLLITLVDKKGVDKLTTIADILADNDKFMIISELEHEYDLATKTLKIKQIGVAS